MSDRLYAEVSSLEQRGRLRDLEVLLVGVEDMISREVIRSLVEDGATVTAAAEEEGPLAHLQRDLGLYRTTVNIAQIDLFSPSEMALFADNLRGQRRLPHMVICCRAHPPSPFPYALSSLRPSLVLQALPPPAAWLSRAVASLNTPTLPALLERPRRSGLFDPKAPPQRVLIAGRLFALCRWDVASGLGTGRWPIANSNRSPSAVGAMR